METAFNSNPKGSNRLKLFIGVMIAFSAALLATNLGTDRLVIMK